MTNLTCAGAAPDTHFQKKYVGIDCNIYNLHFDNISKFLTDLVNKFSSYMSSHYFNYQCLPPTRKSHVHAGPTLGDWATSVPH